MKHEYLLRSGVAELGPIEVESGKEVRLVIATDEPALLHSFVVYEESCPYFEIVSLHVGRDLLIAGPTPAEVYRAGITWKDRLGSVRWGVDRVVNLIVCNGSGASRTFRARVEASPSVRRGVRGVTS
jgi:hypothetical protein